MCSVSSATEGQNEYVLLLFCTFISICNLADVQIQSDFKGRLSRKYIGDEGVIILTH